MQQAITFLTLGNVLIEPLPALTTAANRIVQASTLSPFRLLGVNRSGLEYCSPDPPGSLARAGITPEELDAIAGWGANCIRLPFNQSWTCFEPYLAAIDNIVDGAAARGLYTILDLQWLDAEQPRGTLANGAPNYVPPLPNAHSIETWRRLARRYSGRTSVLFDIFNEPHDALTDDPLHRRRVRYREWASWAERLIRAIRTEYESALIFVSGLDWGYVLRDFPRNPPPGCRAVAVNSGKCRA